jgi:hypothetical protein
MMRLFVKIFLFVMALGLSAQLSCAEAQDAPDTRTTKGVLPHCQAGTAANSTDVLGGRCAGIIATLSFVSRVLPDNLKFCQPSGSTPEQMVQAIASFVEANPDSSAQDFRLVALAAMRAKWPCQE